MPFHPNPFAKELQRLARRSAVRLPEKRILAHYHCDKIAKSVKDDIARQLPDSVARDEILFLREPGALLLVNPRNAPTL